jgi:molybdopterin/thiamine biosynthesis adenylyltransferase
VLGPHHVCREDKNSPMDVKLSEKELERYNRQMLIRNWGEEGQQKLRSSTVFIAGAGGLGSPVAIYLAAAGVGRIRICDNGEPELSNLNRQILHAEKDIGKNKTFSARETLHELNPHVVVEALPKKITSESVDRLAGGSDIIIDCLDNFPTRHILNRYAVDKQLPFIHAGIYGLSGQLTFIHTPVTPCLYCIFPGSPPPAVFPVAGVTPGVIGVLEALEAIKWIVGIGKNLTGRLLIWDGELMEFQNVAVTKDPNCPVCKS